MALNISFDLTSDAGLSGLNKFLASRSYIVGFAPTQDDVAVFNGLGKAPEKQKFPNVFRFYSHINSFGEEGRAQLPAGLAGVTVGGAAVVAPAAAGAGGKGAAAPAADDDSDDDLFGSDDDDDGAAAAAAAKKAADAKKKKPKKVVIDKSQIILEVKPEEAGQDMAALEAGVRAITLDGLVWGQEFQVEDVAFGIQKLIVLCVVEDDKVGLDDITEPIEALEGVQSVDMSSMSKVSGR